MSAGNALRVETKDERVTFRLLGGEIRKTFAV